MSASWRDDIRAVLCPDRVILVRIAKGFRRRVVAKELVTLERFEATDWQGPVETLRALLAQPAWKRSAAATVILSNHFVRYHLVPWSAELAGEDEERAWVGRHFTYVYGETAGSFEYRWNADAPDAPCFASGIDRGLLSAIQAAFSASASSLRSVQPYFMYAFNRWRQQLRGKRQWFVLGEPGHACIASVERERWVSFRALRTGIDWSTEVPVALEREMLLAGARGEGEVLVHFAGIAEAALLRVVEPPARALSARPVPGYSPLADPDYAMAFSGAA